MIAILSRIAAIGCIVFSMMCVGMILIGRAQPQPEFFRYFGICEGVPCYMGIVPGQTTWDEAQRIITNTPNFSVYTDEINTFSVFNPPQHIKFLVRENIVLVIDIRLDGNNTPALGNMILRLGYPCALGLSSVPLLFAYPYLLVWDEQVVSPPIVIHPAMLLERVELRNETNTCSGILLERGGHPWIGFKQYPHPGPYIIP